MKETEESRDGGRVQQGYSVEVTFALRSRGSKRRTPDLGIPGCICSVPESLEHDKGEE